MSTDAPLEPHPHASPPEAFAVRDCTLVAMTTGLSAQNLREFTAGLREAPLSSIYHHFWGRLMWPRFDEPEFNNDFAGWVRHALHEKELAERLSVVHPSDYESLDELREELLEILEAALDEREAPSWARGEDVFNFVKGQMVIFDRETRWETPKEMGAGIAELSVGSIYYHFIDARIRTDDGNDDFSNWLVQFGPDYIAVAEALRQIDPFFSSLADLRSDIAGTFAAHGEEVRA